MKDIYYPKHY